MRCHKWSMKLITTAEDIRATDVLVNFSATKVSHRKNSDILKKPRYEITVSITTFWHFLE